MASAMVVLLGAAGCGSTIGGRSNTAATKQTASTASGSPAASSSVGQGPPRTALSVTYYPHGHQSSGARRWRLTCQPAGGTHPNARGACRELSADRAALRAAVRPCLRALTRLGAPETYVSGNLGGRVVDRLLRPVCDPAAWSSLHVLLTGS